MVWFFSAAFVLSCLFSLLPRRAFSRGLWLLGLVLVWWFLSGVPPARCHIDDWACHSLRAFVMLAGLVMLPPIVIRLCLHGSGRRTGPDTKPRLLWLVDGVLWAATGALAAALGFVVLILIMAGTGLGLASQLLLSGVSLALAHLLWAINRPVAMGAMIGTAALHGYSLTYPDRVQDQIDARAQGRVACLYLPDQDRAATRRWDMTLLSLDKHPHPVLVIATPDGPRGVGWSYRHEAFRPDRHGLATLPDPVTCARVTD